MNIRVLISVAATTGLVFYAGAASTHHSVPTNYFLYAEGGVELMGTVKEFDVRNPHSLITNGLSSGRMETLFAVEGWRLLELRWVRKWSSMRENTAALRMLRMLGMS